MFIYTFNGIVLELDEPEVASSYYPLKIESWNLEFCPFKGFARWSGEKDEFGDWVGVWTEIDPKDLKRIKSGISLVGRDSCGFDAPISEFNAALKRGATVKNGMMVFSDNSCTEFPYG